jgi:phosphatidate cytidylyltransferase
MQFWLVGTRHFDLFTVFIPVYVFLAIPVVSALANDPQRFLERNAKLQWGIMVCIYGMSHVPALLLLEFPATDRGAFLVFFLVLVVQTCMVVQHLVSRRWPRPPRAPAISSSFNWTSWWRRRGHRQRAGRPAGRHHAVQARAGHGHGADRLRGRLAGAPGDEGAQARPRRAELGRAGQSVTGASGLLDRVDALCFAAPVFFHSVRWYFGA